MHYQGDDAPHHQQYSNNKWGRAFFMFKFQMGREEGRLGNVDIPADLVSGA